MIWTFEAARDLRRKTGLRWTRLQGLEDHQWLTMIITRMRRRLSSANPSSTVNSSSRVRVPYVAWTKAISRIRTRVKNSSLALVWWTVRWSEPSTLVPTNCPSIRLEVSAIGLPVSVARINRGFASITRQFNKKKLFYRLDYINSS